METAIIILVVIDIFVSGFIIYSGGEQHDRIEKKVDWLIDAHEAKEAEEAEDETKKMIEELPPEVYGTLEGHPLKPAEGE